MKGICLATLTFILTLSFVFVQDPKAGCPPVPTQSAEDTGLPLVCDWEMVNECAPGNGDGRNVVISITGHTKYQVDWCYSSDCQTCNTPCSTNANQPTPAIKAGCPDCGAENVKEYIWKCQSS